MDYAVQYSALQRRYESLLADMRQVLGMLRRGRHRQALTLLDSVLGDASDTSGRTSDASDEAEPITVEDVQFALLSQVPAAAAAPATFVGRSFRLDDVPDRPDAASDSSQEPHCCRCGDRENLHTFDRSDVSGAWVNVECAAERTYCLDCLNACLSG